MPQWCTKHKMHTIDENCPGCTAEVAAKKLDTRRLDWLSRHIGQVNYDSSNGRFYFVTKRMRVRRTYTTLRKAIDDGMREEE